MCWSVVLLFPKCVCSLLQEVYSIVHVDTCSNSSIAAKEARGGSNHAVRKPKLKNLSYHITSPVWETNAMAAYGVCYTAVCSTLGTRNHRNMSNKMGTGGLESGLRDATRKPK